MVVNELRGLGHLRIIDIAALITEIDECSNSSIYFFLT